MDRSTGALTCSALEQDGPCTATREGHACIPASHCTAAQHVCTGPTCLCPHCHAAHMRNANQETMPADCAGYSCHYQDVTHTGRAQGHQRMLTLKVTDSQGYCNCIHEGSKDTATEFKRFQVFLMGTALAVVLQRHRVVHIRIPYYGVHRVCNVTGTANSVAPWALGVVWKPS